MAEAQAFHGSIEAPMAFVAEMAAGARVNAEVIALQCEMGDVAGVLYGCKRLAAYLDAMRAGAAEIERHRALEAYRRSGSTIGEGQGV